MDLYRAASVSVKDCDNVEETGYWAFPGKCSLQLSLHEHGLLLGGICCCAIFKVQKIPNGFNPKMHLAHQVTVVKEWCLLMVAIACYPRCSSCWEQECGKRLKWRSCILVVWSFAQKMAQRPASASSAAADSPTSDKLVRFLFQGFWCSKQGWHTG